MTTHTGLLAQDNAGPQGASESTRAANFNRLARLYRWMEYASFGPWLWWCRCAFLFEFRNCRRAAILGDGDGRFTARLLVANPFIEIDAVDASEAMLRSLMRRAGPHAQRIRTRCGDARNWQPNGQPYDLIVTHFFLDCLTTAEVRTLAMKMRGCAAPAAQWVVSEFAAPEGWFGRAVARPIIWLLYRAFGLLTGLAVRRLPDHCAALREAGFALEKRRTWIGGLLASELWRAKPRADG